VPSDRSTRCLALAHPEQPANLFSAWPVAGTDECLGLERARGAKDAYASFTRLDPDGWLVRIGRGPA